MGIKFRWVALLLAGITLLSLGLTAVTYTAPATKDEFSVVAVSYPLYTAALNVVGDTAGVTVSCLLPPSAGCAHDYQLSPAQMRVLATCDVVVRGAGESFLEGALEALPETVSVDTAAGIPLLSACEEEHHDHHHHENEHLWVSPARYRAQVENLLGGLCKADPKHAAAYTRNAAAYVEKIRAVEERLTAVAFDGAVLFHDSVAYVAEAVGLPVLFTLPLGEEQGVSASDLAEAAKAVKGKRVVLLYDSQFADEDAFAETEAEKTEAVVWDIGVTPRESVAAKDAWLVAMEQNLKRWEAIG